MTKKELIALLQGYKTLKSCFLKRQLYLFWNKEIDWRESFAGGGGIFDPIKELRKCLIRELAHDSPLLEINFRIQCGRICRSVESKLSELPECSAHMIFDFYINHDYCWKHKKFKGLSERELADKFNISKTTVRKKLENSISQLLKMYEKMPENEEITENTKKQASFTI